MTTKERIEAKSNAGINWRCTTIEFENEFLHIYFYESPEKPRYFSSRHEILREAKKQNWGKGYSVRFDKMNFGKYDPNKDHLHVYLKGNELFAINRDGSAHDKSHGKRIPNHIANKIRSKYPDFVLPSNNTIESAENQHTEEQEEILELLDDQEQYRTQILHR